MAEPSDGSSSRAPTSVSNLVRQGLAWHFTRYSSEVALARAEAEARRVGAGLWADASPVPPWQWRTAKRRR